MRIQRVHTRSVALVGAALSGAACVRANYVECEDNTDCEYAAGGECLLYPNTGSSWCTFPDDACPSGRRWESVAVRDDIAGMCVPDSQPGCTPMLAWQRDIEVYTANIDGTAQTNLTNSPLTDAFPAWSPDGSRIAYTRGLGIWLMNADGSSPRPLTDGTSADAYPNWRPDGNRVGFLRAPTPDIVMFDMWELDPQDSSSAVNLSLEVSTSDGPFAWSPDGARIAFYSTRGMQDLWLANADGSNQVRLTTDGQTGTMDPLDPPQWSPDGTRILHVSRGNVWVIEPSGANAQNLSAVSGVLVEWPRWSSDGSQVIYERDDVLYVMGADGSGQRALEGAGVSCQQPAISEDGQLVACSSERDGNSEIYVLGIDGSNPTRITNDAARDTSPSFRPCP